MGILKSLLKFFQVVSVVMIPVCALQHYFKMFNFAEPFNAMALNFFGMFTQLVINGIDLTLLFLILPWVFWVVVCGILSNFIAGLNKATVKAIEAYQEKKLYDRMEAKKQAEKEELQKKNMVYMAISLNFAKFTISNLSDKEIDAKKQEVKNKLYKDIENYRGKLIEDEEFEDEDTSAFIFFSQEDALNFIFKFKEMTSLLDNDIQNFGYSLNYRIMLDSQSPDAVPYEVLQFLEKALKTVETHEICTTNSFADKYRNYGAMKHLSFHSKGTYSINKVKVELNKLSY